MIKRAMKEFHRVLNPAGWAVIQFPINADRMFEDPNIVDQKECLKLFGQEDQVRKYGLDYVERLSECGFIVERIPASVVSGLENISLMNIPKNELEFFCTEILNKVLERTRERVALLAG